VLLLGYLGEIILRVVKDKQAPTLPEWDDLSKYFSGGFKLFGVGVVYTLPAVLLMGIGYLGMFLPIFLMELGVMGESEALGLVFAGYIAGFGLIGIGAVLSMLTGMILPVAGSHAIVKEDFKAAFRLREIWAIFKANWEGFLIAYLILIGAAILLYYGTYFLVLTVVLCCLYPFALIIMTAYLGVVGAGLFGEAYRAAQEKLPETDQ
jgi:hypothetical protein